MQLAGLGIYTFGEAARLTDIQPAKLRRWLRGYSYKHGESNRASEPLWLPEIAESGLEGISFHDLLEVRFVDAFVRAGVSLPIIRRVAQTAKEVYGSAYPFTQRRFRTDGKTIFETAVKESGEPELLDLLKRQYAFEQIIGSSLYAGIDFDDNEQRALRWYPIAKSKSVVLDPAIAFGKPIVANCGIRTDILYSAFQAEQNKQRVARQFEVPVQAVDAAIRFEERIAA